MALETHNGEDAEVIEEHQWGHRESVSWDSVAVNTPEYNAETYDKSASVEPICAQTHIRKRDGSSVPVHVHVYPGMFHVFLLSPFLPETKHALNTLYDFIHQDCKWK